jgi:hypothetical protein
MVEKAQKLHGARSGLYGECSNAVPPSHFFGSKHRIHYTFKSYTPLLLSVFKVPLFLKNLYLYW